MNKNQLNEYLESLQKKDRRLQDYVFQKCSQQF